jgi:hypothetical protein
VPGVLERDDLSVTLAPGLVLEDDVVVAVRVERRVKVDKIDRVGRDIGPEDAEVVAVVEGVGFHSRTVTAPEVGTAARNRPAI